MRTIRGKLFVYFFIFVILFQATAILIFFSSNNLTNTYHESFRRFLLLNSISQETENLYLNTRLFVTEPNEETEWKYYRTKESLRREKAKLIGLFQHIDPIEMGNYTNLIETVIYESELTTGFSLMDNIEKYTYHLQELRNASQYVQEATLELIDMELTSYQYFYRDLQTRNDDFFLFIIFLFLTTTMLAIFFAIWFSKGITTPVETLSNAAKEVAKGNLQGKPVEIHTNDELKLLGDTFNSMRSNIHQLVQEIKHQSELDRLVKEMELKHLQNQINPHFLFNTLNTVSKMAYLEDANSTSRLIDSIATLLRYSLGDITERVTLLDEVKVVEDYFQIQKTRFSERVRFYVHVDPDCFETIVPKLTLQPLVENAFIHGIENKEEGGTISLRVYSSNNVVIVEVQDDGVGMDQATIEGILSQPDDNQKEHVGHSTGLGLTNVIRRLQLFYKTEHVVEIESAIGKGSTIRLLLPRDMQQVEGDENADSDRGR